MVTGNIDTKTVFKKTEKIFSKVKKGKNKFSKKAKISQGFPEIKIINKECDQTHLALACSTGFGANDERIYPLKLLSVILGGNMSSRLFIEIREKLGLAYHISSLLALYTDCGYFGLSAGIQHEKMEKTIKKALQIIKNIKEKGVTEKELSGAKGYIRGQTAIGLDTVEDISGFIINQELLNDKILQPEEILEKIEKVAKNDIIKIARDIFKPEKISMAVIGQHKNIKQKQEDYKKLFLKLC
jgi:predicted Zn-dependent peptidase